MQFPNDSDYVFASPVMLGRKPLSSNSAQRDKLRPASMDGHGGEVASANRDANSRLMRKLLDETSEQGSDASVQ